MGAAILVKEWMQICNGMGRIKLIKSAIFYYTNPIFNMFISSEGYPLARIYL